jgi:hypothetical protein
MPWPSTGTCNSSEQVDDEPGYVHTVAPDPRRLEPLDNPVRLHVLDASSIILTYN